MSYYYCLLIKIITLLFVPLLCLFTSHVNYINVIVTDFIPFISMLDIHTYNDTF